MSSSKLLSSLLALLLSLGSASAQTVPLGSGILQGPSGGTLTPIFSIFQPAATTTTYFGDFAVAPLSAQGGLTNAATGRQVPIAAAGSIKDLACNTPAITGGTGGAVFFVKNGVQETVNCTTPTGTDTTHSDAVNACDLIQWKFNPGGGTWVASQGQVASVFQSSTANQVVIETSPSSGALAVSATEFLSLGAPFTSVSDSASSGLFGIAGQIQGLCFFPNANDTGANQHTATIWHNGASGTMACSDASDGLGCCANVTGTGFIGGSGVKACSATAFSPVSISSGDTVSIQITCGGTCSSITPGVGLLFVPSVPNQVPLFAVSNNPTTFPAWYSTTDAASASVGTTNFIGSIAPAGISSITFSNLTACSQFNPGSAHTRTFQPEYATSLITPTTAMPQSVSYTISQNCTGYLVSSLGWAGGGSDTTDTFVGHAGYTFNTESSATSGSTVGTLYKISQTAVVK